MKKYYRFSFLLLLISFFINSCVSSLYPLTENEKDFVFKKELPGHWKVDKDNEEYIIDTTNKNMYRITVIGKKDSGTVSNNAPGNDTSFYLAFLVKIHGQYFLDCRVDTKRPAFAEMNEDERSGILLIHYIFNIRNIQQNSMLVSGINKDSLANLIKKRKLSVKHEMLTPDHLLLTEKPASLQHKLSAAVTRNSFFDEPSLLKRKD
jgi:hypothetical protein